MKQGITVFAVCSFLLLPLISRAQTFYGYGSQQRSLILHGGLGTSSYFGDLKDPGDLIDAKPTVSIGLQNYFWPRLSVRGELSMFTLKGDDASSDDPGRQVRNLSFKSTNFELNMVFMADLFPHAGRRFYQRPNFNAYAFAGVGLMYMNPRAELNGKMYALQPLKTENVSYSRFQPVIPYGIGFRIKVNPFMNIGIESGWRLTFTDYIDDVSTVHPDKTGWDPIRAQLSDRSDVGFKPGHVRGDPNNNDAFHSLTLKIEYYLPYNFLFGDYYKKLYTIPRRPAHR
ncbi:MAG: DUF6089 family protein [Cyclobacteriaceae bacterium]|nr:DUF6089 family protein [Cyclobacteriaceae bacterium]